jgi:hypothetical protein
MSLLDFIPVAGYLKGLVHMVLGEQEAASKAVHNCNTAMKVIGELAVDEALDYFEDDDPLDQIVDGLVDHVCKTLAK